MRLSFDAVRNYRWKACLNKTTLLFFFAGLLIIVGIQQIPKTNELQPVALINGKLHRLHDEQTLLSAFEPILDEEFSIITQDKTYSFPKKDLGLSIDKVKTVEAYRAKSRWIRLIPFSVLYQISKQHDIATIGYTNSIQIVVEAIADEVYIPAKNAYMSVEENNVTIAPHIDGRQIDGDESTHIVIEALTGFRSTARLPVKTTTAEVNTQALETAFIEYTANFPDSIDIAVYGENYILENKTLKSWLSYDYSDEIRLFFDEDKARPTTEQFIESHPSLFLPSETIIKLLDNDEVSRIPGIYGYEISLPELMVDLQGAISSGRSYVKANVVQTEPRVSYLRDYSKSEAGLQNLINSISKGRDIAIQYIDLHDRGWSAGYNQYQKRHMASTYKLFVAYSSLKRVDSAEWKLSDGVGEQTLEQCLSVIIIDSENECSIAIAQRIGWQQIVKEAGEIGTTNLDWREDVIGTASDPATFLLKLAREEILSDSSREFLIGLMSRQRFREAIPEGSSYDVADKVGFLDGTLNDAAIVFAGDKPYVLVIYTFDESWRLMAEITRQIEALVL